MNFPFHKAGLPLPQERI